MKYASRKCYYKKGRNKMGVASLNQLLASSYLYFTAAFRYGGGLFSFTALIRTITEAFSTELELHEVVLVCGMASNDVEDCNVHYACYPTAC